MQSLYFSVVTVTTLGFGDLTPKLDVTLLLLAVTAQVIIGVITIGLFLSAISHKLSERAISAQKSHDEEIENSNLANLLTIFRPVIISYLKVLAETYKVTTTRKDDDYVELTPKQAFSPDYYDQLSRQDFLSNDTNDEKFKTWGDFIQQENGKFTDQINDYLNKFAISLPLELVVLLVDLKNHDFLNHWRQASKINQVENKQGFKVLKINTLVSQHSCYGIPENPQSIRDFHDKLLKLISHLEDKTTGEKIIMTIDLRKECVAPNIGSAIADISIFGGP